MSSTPAETTGLLSSEDRSKSFYFEEKNNVADVDGDKSVQILPKGTTSEQVSYGKPCTIVSDDDGKQTRTPEQWDGAVGPPPSAPFCPKPARLCALSCPPNLCAAPKLWKSLVCEWRRSEAPQDQLGGAGRRCPDPVHA